MIESIRKRAVHRTKIIKGQLDGLENMIQREDYCMDILTQSLAIQKSLQSLNKLILENHIRTHVKSGLASGDAKTEENTTAELLQLYELSNIRAR